MPQAGVSLTVAACIAFLLVGGACFKDKAATRGVDAAGAAAAAVYVQVTMRVAACLSDNFLLSLSSLPETQRQFIIAISTCKDEDLLGHLRPFKVRV